MVKKIFALASITALTGLVSAAASSGCSSSTTETSGDAAPDVKKDVIKTDATDPTTPEEKTVGNLCKTDADCAVAGSVGDNQCSIGFFTIGDLFGDPVCVSPCKRGAGSTFGDIECDGDSTGAPGVCNAPAAGASGVCLPACEFNATKISLDCQGSNKCAALYFGTTSANEVFSLGICLGNCAKDADCKGSPGQKCQTEDGLCVNTDKFVAYAKTTIGASCDGSKTVQECNCNTVGGTTANKDKGYCTFGCLTGAAGNTFCAGKNAAWSCTAGLPTKFTDGKAAFTGAPDGILGQCALPCSVDTDCTAFGTTIIGGATPAAKCEPTAGAPTGKTGFCNVPSQ